MSSSFDLWRVQLANGEVVLMSLDQLDEAFQNGVVHERTNVLREGTNDWMSLAEAAGLGADEPVTVTPSAYPPPALVIDTPGPSSIRPFVSDVSDLEVDFAPRRSSKRPVFAVLAAAMILGGAGFGATRVPAVRAHLDGLLASNPSPVANVAAAVHAPAQPAAIPAPAQPAAPAPQAATPATVSVDALPAANGASSSRLTPDQIHALLEGDKTRAEVTEKKHAAKRAAHAHAHAHHKAHGKAPFSKGGNKYDPLNASL